MLKTLRKIKRNLNKYSNSISSLVSYFSLRKLPDGNYKVRDSIKYYGQFASPELTKDILEKKISAKDDPRWREFGFLNPEDYEFWSWRACAIICLKMIIDTFGEENTRVNDLTEGCIKLGGYISHDKNGKLVDRGWYYKPLINLAGKYGLDGKIFSHLSVGNICQEILNKHFVVASVDPNVIRYDKTESDGTGGHLVLIYGFRWTDGQCAGFYLHNPSGKSAETRIAFIPIEIFKSAFAEKGFSVWKKAGPSVNQFTS